MPRSVVFMDPAVFLNACFGLHPNNHYKRFLTFPGGLLHIKMHKQDLDDNCIDLFVLVQPD